MIPIHRLTKKELAWRATHTCVAHQTSYLEHPKCYVREQADRSEKIGFLDIETTNLSADFGIMLSWCLKEAGNSEILSDVITTEDLHTDRAGEEDKRIVKSLIRALAGFDKIVTYYGKRFDVPFIRTRALSCGIKFPLYGTLAHVDLYDTVKRKFRLSSNRLEQACRVLLGDTNKTKIEYKYWRAAGRGDAKSLAYVLKHNKFDVIDLERLFDKTIEFSRKQDASI